LHNRMQMRLSLPGTLIQGPWDEANEIKDVSLN